MCLKAVSFKLNNQKFGKFNNPDAVKSLKARYITQFN